MSAAPQAEQLHPAHEQAETPRQLTWQEHQAAADEAWNQAIDRTALIRPEGEKNPAPLDEKTLDLYGQARDHLKAVIFLGPDGPTDPFNLLKLGGSQAALAEATPVGVFYETGGRHIDIQSNLQESARQNLRRAAAMLMGNEGKAAAEVADGMANVDPAEVVEVMTEVDEVATEVDDDAESMRRVAAKAVEQLTGEHELPSAAEVEQHQPLAV